MAQSRSFAVEFSASNDKGENIKVALSDKKEAFPLYFDH